MNYKIAIIDDEPERTAELEGLIARYHEEHPEDDYSAESFHSAENFLSRGCNGYDVIFLDIQMPSVSGMDVARRIRETDKTVLLVFVTNMAQYALESYDVHAYDFILKPIGYKGFAMRFDRIHRELSHRQTGAEIALSYGTEKRRMRVCDITYAEVAGHNVIVHTSDGDGFRVRSSLADLEKKLEPFCFVRCNSCYLVNLDHVKRIKGDYAVVGEDELRISHLKRPSFLGALAKYMGKSI